MSKVKPLNEQERAYYDRERKTSNIFLFLSLGSFIVTFVLMVISFFFSFMSWQYWVFLSAVVVTLVPSVIFGKICITHRRNIAEYALRVKMSKK